MENIKFISAGYSGLFDTKNGMIEEGNILIDVDGEDVYLTIQIDGNGDDYILLDDLEYISQMESIGIEFFEDELIGPETFLTDLRMFYDSETS
jgi:hypothetical protein